MKTIDCPDMVPGEERRHMKLEELLGEELYSQVKAKIDEVNSKETDKLKHVKFADLSEGSYVKKEKYNLLETEKASVADRLDKANKLIEELKKDNKGNEEMQGKINTYEQEKEALQQELKETKLKAAVKVALLSEKAVDVDYLTFKLSEKLKEKGEKLELDDNENIKGWDDKLSGLKTQFPNMFESSQGDNRRILENRLKDGDGAGGTLTRKDILSKPYSERARIYNENPDAYNAVMHPSN